MAAEQWLISFITDYISARKELQESVTSRGEIPRAVCECCPVGHPRRQFLDELTQSEMSIAKRAAREIKRYGIISLSRQDAQSDVYLKCRKPIREICPDPKSLQREVGEMESKDDSGRTVYSYVVPTYTEAYQQSFLRRIIAAFDGGILQCPHVVAQLARGGSARAIARRLRREEYVYEESMPGAASSEDRLQWVQYLFLCCTKCCSEMQKRACANALEFTGYTYNNDRCNWKRALFMQMLREIDKHFNVVGGRYSSRIVIQPDDVLVSFSSWYDIEDDLIRSVDPSAVVIFGARKDMLPLLKFKVDVVCIDGDSVIRYDSDRQVEGDIGKIIEHLVTHLEPYCEEARGTDHDRYNEAMARIGQDLGFVHELEYPNKRTRIDCVWLDREGGVYAAIEVETKPAFKKDIVSTWEVEPQLAIVLSHARNDDGIMFLSEYVLMKSIPHPFLAVNTQTKRLYFFRGQELACTEALCTPTQDDSHVEEM